MQLLMTGQEKTYKKLTVTAPQSLPEHCSFSVDTSLFTEVFINTNNVTEIIERNHIMMFYKYNVFVQTACLACFIKQTATNNDRVVTLD
jgi:hypothetical protein